MNFYHYQSNGSNCVGTDDDEDDGDGADDGASVDDDAYDAVSNDDAVR